MNEEKRRRYDQYGEEGLEDDGHRSHNPFDIFERFGFGSGGSGGRRKTRAPFPFSQSSVV